MANDYNEKIYRLMPYGTPAPFGFASLPFPGPTAAPSNDFDSAGPAVPGFIEGFGSSRYSSSEPMSNFASNDDESYTSPRRGFTPIPFDVTAPWNPWREQAAKGLMGLLNAYRSYFGMPNQSAGEDDVKDQCDHQYYNVDIPACRAISRARGKAAGARCYATAADRYGNCIAERSARPPLDTWNN